MIAYQAILSGNEYDKLNWMLEEYMVIMI